MKLADGTESDGITYRVELVGREWIATVARPDGKTFTDKWEMQHAPVCGPDVVDVARGNDVLEKLIQKARK